MSERATKNVASAPHWIHGVVKLLACVVGLPLAVLGTMSVLGMVTTHAWLRIGGALVIVGVVPLVLADRLLPADAARSARGLVTDVLAFAWMAMATAVVALGPTTLRVPLWAEAQRCEDAGWTRVAVFGRWLAPTPTSEESETRLASLEPTELQPTETQTPVVLDPETASEEPEPTATDEPSEEDAASASPASTEATKTRQPLDPAELFEAWAPTVVTIKAKTPLGFGGTGTGFIVSSDGLVATNHHVIDGSAALELALFDGTVIEETEVLASDETVDLALLRVKTDAPLVPVVLGDSASVKVGEPVVVIGNPLGLEHTLSDGLLSARRLHAGKRYIQMTAPVSPGNSGGPVFNRYGEVIGITVAKIGYGAGENLNLAIPVDQLTPLLEAPNKKGRSRW